MSDLATEPVVKALEVACPSCGSVFPVDPLRIPPQGILAICSACLRTFPILRPDGLPLAPVLPVSAPGSQGAGEAVTEERAPERRVEGMTEVEVTETVIEEVTETISEDAVVVEALAEGGKGASGAEDAAGAATTDRGEVEAEAEAKGREASDAPDAPSDPAITSWDAPADASSPAPPASSPRASDPPPPAPAPDPGPPPSTARPRALGVPGGIGGGGRTGVAAGAARFGSRDPSDRARRLARVLASDMITYNPARYADARKGGTLVEDFREEIEKSWEEYVDQVGAELAGSTDHFVDALNEVLARGEVLFHGPGYPYEDPPA